MRPGQSRFDVKVERHLEVDDYEPKFRRAERRTIDVPVDDGFLDIEFVHHLGPPSVSAIKIERIGEL